MKNCKYENVDVIAFLEEKMKSNTENYQSDFEYDKEFLLRETAHLTGVENFLWLSRKSGTHCMLERNVFIDGTGSNITWKHFEGYDPAEFLAFAIEAKCVKDGVITGDCYALDYMAHIQEVKNNAVKAKEEILLFQDNHEEKIVFPINYFRAADLVDVHGSIISQYYIPEDEQRLKSVLAMQAKKRKEMNPEKHMSLSKKINIIESEKNQTVGKKKQPNQDSPQR